ncbi:hypothetical protein [Streptomyces sp. NPDC054865]
MKPRGSRLASATLLKAFLDECGVVEPEAGKWLSARERIAGTTAQPLDRSIVPGQPFRSMDGLLGGPCYGLEQAADIAADRREKDEAIRARCGEKELDWYDQQLSRELRYEELDSNIDDLIDYVRSYQDETELIGMAKAPTSPDLQPGDLIIIDGRPVTVQVKHFHAPHTHSGSELPPDHPVVEIVTSQDSLFLTLIPQA